jgi:hypothetical protein
MPLEWGELIEKALRKLTIVTILPERWPPPCWQSPITALSRQARESLCHRLLVKRTIQAQDMASGALGKAFRVCRLLPHT